MKLILTYGIPTLPLIIAALVAMIGPLPDAPQDHKIVRQPRVGLKTRLDNLWYGDQENTRVSVKIGEPKFVPDEPEPEPEPSANGAKGNPTTRQR